MLREPPMCQVLPCSWVAIPIAGVAAFGGVEAIGGATPACAGAPARPELLDPDEDWHG